MSVGPVPERLHHVIDGASAEPSTGEWMTSYDPSTGAPLTDVPLGDGRDVDAAVAASMRAWAGWRDRRPGDRGRVLTEVARGIRERADELAALESRDAGKPIGQARGEIEVAARYFEFYGGLVDAIGGETIDLGTAYHSYTRREPYGVVAVILPWNAPLNQAARAIAPALAAGNAVVAKPSEETSITCVELAHMAVARGLPPGVLNVVLGTGSAVGESLVRHPMVRMVAFTGSQGVGRKVGAIAAERIIPVTLELGGKSPNIVFEDADLDAAATGVTLSFAGNAGQICIAGSRLIVHRSIHDDLVARIAERVDRLVVGPGDADPNVGPVTTRAQRAKVEEYHQIAAEEGARAIVGGPSDDERRGWYVRPTVYVDVDPAMRIAREEIFGPVLTVLPFDDEEEAIALANDTEFGLAACIWTCDLPRAHRVAARVEAGQIYVNEYFAGGVETPLGGYKASGIGREKGREALVHYTQLKCVTVRL